MEKKRLVWSGNFSEMSVGTRQEADKALKAIGTTGRGAEIMAEKMLFKVIKLTGVDTRAANILKQTMLSQGADAAVSAGTVNLAVKETDVLIFATVHQLRPAIERLKEQPWGLKDIAEILEKNI